jgi:hypothetical protein
LPGFRISFKIGFGYFLLKRLEASLELGFSHARFRQLYDAASSS